MSPSPKSASKAITRAQPAQRQRPYPTLRLNPTMACDTAFRVVARRCLYNLTANHEATCKGDPGALHQMRIALTRLRTAILFFSPMVDDPERTRIRDELKWLNAQLGSVRDLDVAIERLKDVSKQRPQAISDYEHWNEKRADSHRHLARALRSARYLRKAQKSLGQLNDDANGHSLATALQGNGIPAPLEFLSAKREKRLIRTAAAAYRKLAALKPFRNLRGHHDHW